MRKADRNYSPGRNSPKAWQAENNRLAEQMRKSREADKSVPAGVNVKEWKK